MSLPGSIKDREYRKFRDGEDDVSVAVVPDGGSLNVETAGVKWDQIITTFPSAISELFTYKLNGVTVQTVTVTYESAAKKTPINVVKVKF
jgi:hypothetical protein